MKLHFFSDHFRFTEKLIKKYRVSTWPFVSAQFAPFYFWYYCSVLQWCPNIDALKFTIYISFKSELYNMWVLANVCWHMTIISISYRIVSHPSKYPVFHLSIHLSLQCSSPSQAKISLLAYSFISSGLSHAWNHKTYSLVSVFFHLTVYF